MKIPASTAAASMIAIVGLALGSMIGAIASSVHNPFEIKTLILPEEQNAESVPSIVDYIYEADSEWDYKNLETEVQCMAENIYFESRGQPIRGQIAVGLVTINRVKSSKYPNNVCEVVWMQRRNHRTGKLVAQFSWTLDGLPDTPRKGKAWEEAYMIASALLAEGSLYNFYDFTNSATHYHADYVTPAWSKELTRTISVGDHHFYNDTPVALTQ